MKKSTLVLLAMCFLSPLTYAGTETYSGKEMKQVAPLPCPEWYADREFNVGIGIEGWAVDARQAHEDVFIDFSEGIFERSVKHERKAIGSVLATLTFRYPIPCTRFAPYVFAGGGGIFGGGQRTHFVLTTDVEEGEENDVIVTRRTDAEAEWIGQFGGGVEVRLTPHIGWINDFSWNVVNGPENNFGMVRS